MCHAFSKLLDKDYLALIRENYLEEEEDIRPLVREATAALSASELEEVIGAPGWRGAVVGVHCAIATGNPEWVRILAARLTDQCPPLLRRPILLGLAILGSEEAFAAIRDFVSRPYVPDAADDYVAAFEALWHVGDRTCTLLQQEREAALLAEGVTRQNIDRSRMRFRKALNFWASNMPADRHT